MYLIEIGSSSTVNVGIGTSSPISLLQLTNPASYNPSGGFVFMKFENRHYSTLENSIEIGTSSFVPYIKLFGSPTLYTYIGANYSTFNGYVKVDGKLTTKEIEVKSDVWSDFVFKSDYQLMSLDELDNFINKNKHLPNIPSEADVIANGINVAEMNAKLLQKIEELTLYIIEQQKQIEELKKHFNNY